MKRKMCGLSIPDLSRLQTLCCCLLVVLLGSSCENFNLAEEGTETGDSHTSSVRILTRGAGGASLSYPLHVYAFAPDGKLVARQQLENSSEELRLSIPQDQDTRIVVVSADPDAYEIPANPTASSLVTMKTGTSGNSAQGASYSKGYTTTALQMGHVDIHPQTESSTVSIQLYYKVLSLEVNLTELPQTCTSASIAVSSPVSGISLSGEFQGTSSSARIPLYPLQDENPGTFTTGTVYLFPTHGTTSFSIAYNDADGEQVASADYQSPLQAGTPYRLNGIYDDGCLHVGGTVSPSVWSAPVTLDFVFSNGNTSTIGGGTEGTPSTPVDDQTVYPVDVLPLPLTIWNGHIVLDVMGTDEAETVGSTSKGEAQADLLLLSLAEWSDVTSAKNTTSPRTAFETAAGYSEYDMKGWRIPTAYEGTLITRAYHDNPSAFNALLKQAMADPVCLQYENGDNVRYLCEDATKTYSFNNDILSAAGATKTYHLRLVRTVRVQCPR